ncbi:hypothetical protein YC2023_059729 [Brassica napus]
MGSVGEVSGGGFRCGSDDLRGCFVVNYRIFLDVESFLSLIVDDVNDVLLFAKKI